MNKIIEELDKYILNNNAVSFELFKDNIEEITYLVIECLKKDKNITIEKNILEPIVINHIYFMKEAIDTKNSQLILNQLIWEIKSYTKMGVKDEFFIKVLEYFILTLENRLENSYSELAAIYKYILSIFNFLLNESKKKTIIKKQNVYKDVIDELTSSMLEPSITKAILISNNFIKEKSDIKLFWEEIILPVMYNIGNKWSNGEITVGQEHTATSICQRVMSMHYDKILSTCSPKKSVIVAISPKELHQVGARMLADILELNNINVHFLDSNLTAEKISTIIDNESIKDIIISTTLVSNIEATNKLISKLKDKYSNKIRVYVGGQAYSSNKQLIKNTNVDVYAPNIDFLLKELEESSNDWRI